MELDVIKLISLACGRLTWTGILFSCIISLSISMKGGNVFYCNDDKQMWPQASIYLGRGNVSPSNTPDFPPSPHTHTHKKKREKICRKYMHDITSQIASNQSLKGPKSQNFLKKCSLPSTPPPLPPMLCKASLPPKLKKKKPSDN